MLAVTGTPPAGITTLIVLAWAGIGLNSLGIGILGEYVGRTYSEVKRRPLYLVQEAINLGAPGERGPDAAALPEAARRA